MADTSVPARLEDLEPIAVESRLKTLLTASGLAWADGKLTPTSSTIPQSLSELEHEYRLACRPAPREDIEAWLTVLWVSTKRQGALNEFRLSNIVDVYATALSRYPGDLVRDVLANWTRTPKPKDAHHWWPAVGEIEDAIRGPADTRRMIRDAAKEWDMERSRHDRLSQLYRELAVLEGGDFTFHIRELMHADRETQRAGIAAEAAKVRREIFELEGPNTFARAAGDN